MAHYRESKATEGSALSRRSPIVTRRRAAATANTAGPALPTIDAQVSTEDDEHEGSDYESEDAIVFSLHPLAAAIAETDDVATSGSVHQETPAGAGHSQSYSSNNAIRDVLQEIPGGIGLAAEGKLLEASNGPSWINLGAMIMDRSSTTADSIADGRNNIDHQGSPGRIGHRDDDDDDRTSASSRHRQEHHRPSVALRDDGLYTVHEGLLRNSIHPFRSYDSMCGDEPAGVIRPAGEPAGVEVESDGGIPCIDEDGNEFIDYDYRRAETPTNNVAARQWIGSPVLEVPQLQDEQRDLLLDIMDNLSETSRELILNQIEAIENSTYQINDTVPLISVHAVHVGTTVPNRKSATPSAYTRLQETDLLDPRPIRAEVSIAPTIHEGREVTPGHRSTASRQASTILSASSSQGRVNKPVAQIPHGSFLHQLFGLAEEDEPKQSVPSQRSSYRPEPSTASSSRNSKVRLATVQDRIRTGPPPDSNPPSDSDAGSETSEATSQRSSMSRRQQHIPRDARDADRRSASSFLKGLRLPSPKTWDGTPKYDVYEAFCYSIYDVVEMNQVPANIRVRLIRHFLSGPAERWFMSYVAPSIAKWTLKSVLQGLFNYFFPATFKEEMRDRFKNATQGSRSILDFERYLRTTSNRLHDVTDRELRERFWEGVKPYIRVKWAESGLTREASDLDALVEAAERYEKAQVQQQLEERRNYRSHIATKWESRAQDESDRERSRSPPRRQYTRQEQYQDQNQASNQRRDDQDDEMEQIHSRRSTKPPQNRQRPSYDRDVSSGPRVDNAARRKEESQLRADGKCFACKNTGHIKRDCPTQNTIKGYGNHSMAVSFADIDDMVEVRDSLSVGMVLFGSIGQESPEADLEDKAHQVYWFLEDLDHGAPYGSEIENPVEGPRFEMQPQDAPGLWILTDRFIQHSGLEVSIQFMRDLLKPSDWYRDIIKSLEEHTMQPPTAAHLAEYRAGAQLVVQQLEQGAPYPGDYFGPPRPNKSRFGHYEIWIDDMLVLDAMTGESINIRRAEIMSPSFNPVPMYRLRRHFATLTTQAAPGSSADAPMPTTAKQDTPLSPGSDDSDSPYLTAISGNSEGDNDNEQDLLRVLSEIFGQTHLDNEDNTAASGSGAITNEAHIDHADNSSAIVHAISLEVMGAQPEGESIPEDSDGDTENEFDPTVDDIPEYYPPCRRNDDDDDDTDPEPSNKRRRLHREGAFVSGPTAHETGIHVHSVHISNTKAEPKNDASKTSVASTTTKPTTEAMTEDLGSAVSSETERYKSKAKTNDEENTIATGAAKEPPLRGAPPPALKVVVAQVVEPRRRDVERNTTEGLPATSQADGRDKRNTESNSHIPPALPNIVTNAGLSMYLIFNYNVLPAPAPIPDPALSDRLRLDRILTSNLDTDRAQKLAKIKNDSSKIEHAHEVASSQERLPAHQVQVVQVQLADADHTRVEPTSIATVNMPIVDAVIPIPATVPRPNAIHKADVTIAPRTRTMASRIISNPVYADGVTKACYICGSDDHLADRCRHRPRFPSPVYHKKHTPPPLHQHSHTWQDQNHAGCNRATHQNNNKHHRDNRVAFGSGQLSSNPDLDPEYRL